MPALTDARPFLRHIEAIQSHDPSKYLPFVIAGMTVGLVRKDFCAVLTEFPDVFAIGQAAVTFLPDEDRTDALKKVTHALAGKGLFDIRGEAYPVVTGWREELLATIDRGAYAFFGTAGFGVHVNGLVRKPGGLHLWVARRARDRKVAPGKLDNIIGGGLGAGYTAYETLIKESAEEAGFSADVASQAVPVGAVSYAYDVHNGVKRDTLFLYDLYLPEDLIPVNTDGEVERFDLLPIEEVAALVRDTDEFKTNVNAVIVDLLIRHGYLAPDMPGYQRLVNGLRRSL